MGPIEFVVIVFPGNEFRGEIIPALREAVEHGQMRVIDLTVVRKEENGEVRGMDLTSLPDLDAEWSGHAIDQETSILSTEDVEQIAGRLANNSSAAIVLFEHVWARRLQTAIRRANGKVRFIERVAPSDVEAFMAGAERVQPA
jgi:hypothetical protein